MDFQEIVDSYDMAAVVISVEKKEGGHYGDIRLVKANDLYKKDMPKYQDGMLYSDLIPKEPNFEDFCFRSAVNKKHLHAYVETKTMNIWVESNYIPLSSKYDTENVCHMLFLHEFTTNYESKKMSDVSIQTASLVIQTCINLRGSENFSESMNTVITGIQKQTDSFCSCIIMIDNEKKKFAPLCVKYRDDAATYEDFAEYLTPEVIFSWEESLQKHDIIIVKDEYDMSELEKSNPIWVKSLRDASVKNLILAPLSQGKKMFGVLFITNFDISRIIELKEFIDLSAFFLSSEIANNELMEKLEYMSNIDTLTGVKNRNSMNARVDWHVQKYRRVNAPYGIVFADLNGLKACNDHGGHEAGDELLRNAAKLLRKHFDYYEIYRSGGDEFLVILPNCKKEVFEERVENLRAESGADSEVSLAIGAAWSENEDDLRKNMHLADEAMYADKAKYYKEHPEKARR